MASPGELVRTIAEVLGIPEATVTVLDRNLVVAGLRTKRGRGPSAAEVTTLDGARLLIAGILSPAPVTSTAEVVGWYSQLVAKPVPWLVSSHIRARMTSTAPMTTLGAIAKIGPALGGCPPGTVLTTRSLQ